MLEHFCSGPIPARVRRLGIAVAILGGLFVAYRWLWDDISSPFPYTPWAQADYGGSWTKSRTSLPAPAPWRMPPASDGKPSLFRTAQEHIAEIMSQGGRNDSKVDCPPLDRIRYHDLGYSEQQGQFDGRQYFFALDLRQVVDILPTLMGSVLEAIRFLGPQNCALSVVEGLSIDGTYETLKLLEKQVVGLGALYYLQTSNINPRVGDRIGKLAKLRNLALEPMMATTTQWASNATTILFINDVAICAEDILELVHQKDVQGADMACAMDYHRLNNGQLAFYDVWVSRSMDGDSFFTVPGAGDWSHADDMFPHDRLSRERFLDRKPFQVFSCWNGAAAINAMPFLRGELEFRRAASHKGECGAGEPTLLCKDMWKMGPSRILVVPSISLGYGLDGGKDVKMSRGHTSEWTRNESERSDVSPLRVDWKPDPPGMVRCIPSWRNQFWKPWNDTL